MELTRHFALNPRPTNHCTAVYRLFSRHGRCAICTELKKEKIMLAKKIQLFISEADYLELEEKRQNPP